MRPVIAGTLVIALPGLVAIGLLAAPKPKAAPVPLAGTLQGVGPDGTRYTLAVTGTLAIEPPLPPPPPPPDPLGLAYLTMSPAVVAPGGSALVTVLLTRAPGAPVVIALKSADPDGQVGASMTINAGQASGTAAVTTSPSITREKLIGIVATYNGQSRSANLTVRPGVTPPPPPPPGAGSPLVFAYQNADGSPATFLAYGQELRIVGSGFGPTAGKVTWNGGPVTVLSWSDGEVRVKLPSPSLPAGGHEFTVTRPDGAAYDGMMPLDGPSRVPGSARRR